MKIGWIVVIEGLLLGGLMSAHAQTVTPAQWLAAQPKPCFRPGHTLPRLTRYGWSLPFDTRVELTENWGYALEYGGYVGDLNALADPNSDESRVLALARSDPQRYPVAVICSRQLPGEEAPPETWTRDKDGKVLNGQAKSMDGTQWSEAAGAVFSPEAPVSVWELAGKYRADPLAELRKRGLPISIVLNGGEYGLGVIGFGKKLWELDPKICAAINTETYKGDWATYISERKGRAERTIADVVRTAVPDRTLYVFYTAGGGHLRNKYWGQYEWEYTWKGMRGVSDLPSNEAYYNHYNDGFTGRLNLLTLALNAVAAEIATGDTLSYNWVCAGWPRGDEQKHCADLARWTGFLKCYYTAGMVGANVGYYDLPPGGFGASFSPDNPPVWLQQKVASSHVHALFSQYEDLIRQGDLLPGPMKHAISTSDSAYEFPCGDDAARVLVRKQRGKPVWLITAWAVDGADRVVRVNVPELGNIEVSVRVCGSVYRASLDEDQVTLVQLDPEGATYITAATGKPVVKPIDLAVAKPTSKGLLLWLAADIGVAKEADGTVTSWTSQGTRKLVFTQPDAKRRPTWLTNGMRGKPALRVVTDQQWLGLVDLPRVDAEASAGLAGAFTVIGVFADAQPRNRRILSAITTGGGLDYESGLCLTDDKGTLTPADATDGVLFKVASGEIKTPVRSICVGAMCWGADSDQMGGNGFGYGGNIAELLVYKGALTQADTAPVMDYLRTKYRPVEP